MAEEVARQASERGLTDSIQAEARDELKKDLDDKSKAAPMTLSAAKMQQQEGDRPDNSGAARVNKVESSVLPAAASPSDTRKLIRKAQLDLQVVNYDAAVQRLTTFAAEEHGFVAIQNSAKLPNGKLQGTVVVKVAPDNLDRFLQKARGLGELKNQTLGTDDVTKTYFDTDARLRNAKRMEERLLEMLQKNTGKVSDLLQVEKELARVREQIEQMQGELKYYDHSSSTRPSPFPWWKKI
jgi:Domain of unknown function (DUF4349)